MASRRRTSSGFTLFELVLVMVVIATTLAIAAPSLRGWSRGAQARDQGEQFLAVTRWARTQAVSQAVTHRVTIDPEAGAYQVTARDGNAFVPVGSEFGRVFTVPPGYRIEISREAAPAEVVDATTANSIDFSPTGYAQPAVVRITSAQGDVVLIACPSPAEGYRVVSAAELEGGTL